MAGVKEKAPVKKAAPKVARQKNEEVQATQAQSTIYSVGRRKQSIARIRMVGGSGAITVNGKDFAHYFPVAELQQSLIGPLMATDTRNAVDISVKVIGGGYRGQTDAVRHGIARALLIMNPELKKTLRSYGFLTRDPRVKERKKPGLKRARRAPQFSKR